MLPPSIGSDTCPSKRGGLPAGRVYAVIKISDGSLSEVELFESYIQARELFGRYCDELGPGRGELNGGWEAFLSADGSAAVWLRELAVR